MTGRCAILLLAPLTLAGCELVDRLRRGDSQLSSGETARVSSVIKGDELTLEKDRVGFRVRMLGIQALAPVIDDPDIAKYASSAESYLKTFVGKDVQVFFEAPIKDAAGRYLAYVHESDADVNLQMVQLGLAQVYTEFAFGREPAYLDGEAIARRESRGLWGSDKLRPVLVGLRRQWAALRKKRAEKRPADPLLAD